MSTHKTTETVAVGFLTVRVHQELGYLGGYLLLNSLARPLEFHCTLPVKPTRAQSILYGPTLEDFICGEQIARTLVAKAKLQPWLVVTDSPAVLSMRNVSPIPVVSLREPESSEVASDLRVPAISDVRLASFSLDKVKLSLLESHREDISLIEEQWGKQSKSLDLIEPFTRIHDALLEAHPAAKAA